MKLFCMILQWWAHIIIHLSKPTGCTTPRVNPDVNRGLWGMMTCPCRSINCDKCSALVGEAACGGWRMVYGKSLYFPLNFAVKIKLLLKSS